MKNNDFTVSTLIKDLLCFVLGIILLTSKSTLLDLVALIAGIICTTIGSIQLIFYIYHRVKLNYNNYNELMTGLVFLILGLIVMFYSNVFTVTIRIIIGTFILFTGINRLILALSVKEVDKRSYKTYLGSSIIIFIAGIFLITNLFDRLIGLFIILYALSDIFNYVYYKTQSPAYLSLKTKPTVKKRNKKIKKEKEAIDAIIEE